jgi:Family of unknown function (DUF6812)
MDAINQSEDRRVRVTIEASDFSCEGFVHLPGMRLSDLMNEKTTFVVLLDAVVLHRLAGTAEQRPSRHQTIILRKGEIKYVVPMA